MTEDIRPAVLGILEKYRRPSGNHVYDDSEVADLGIDYLTMMEIVFDLEERFMLRIGDQELVSVRTVRDVVSLISNKLQQMHAPSRT